MARAAGRSDSKGRAEGCAPSEFSSDVVLPNARVSRRHVVGCSYSFATWQHQRNPHRRCRSLGDGAFHWLRVRGRGHAAPAHFHRDRSGPGVEPRHLRHDGRCEQVDAYAVRRSRTYTEPVLGPHHRRNRDREVARTLYRPSGRTGPFFFLDCATVPRELAVSPRLRHTKGALLAHVRAMSERSYSETLELAEALKVAVEEIERE